MADERNLVSHFFCVSFSFFNRLRIITNGSLNVPLSQSARYPPLPTPPKCDNEQNPIPHLANMHLTTQYTFFSNTIVHHFFIIKTTTAQKQLIS